MTSQDLDTVPLAEESGRRHAGLLNRFSRWQRLLLIASIALMVLGLALRGYAFVSAAGGGDEPTMAAGASGAGDAGDAGGDGTDPLRPTGFVASGDPVPAGSFPETAGEDAVGLEGWSPVIFRLGFSFFVGFCIAYAARAFVKISIISIGVLLLALFGLQYAGLIDVDWGAMETIYDNSVKWLREQTAGFGEFIRGALPSAAMGAFGLVLGFRRKA